MKLVKINDVILNMDKVKMITGLNSYNEERGNYVIVYVDDEKLGTCNSREEYEEFIDGLYKELFHAFPHDVIEPKEDEDNNEELWQN
jgi:hypothetical protein